MFQKEDVLIKNVFLKHTLPVLLWRDVVVDKNAVNFIDFKKKYL